MQNIQNKTFVTYPGGSGGDLFTAACNGITVTADQMYHTKHGISYFRVPPYTIKKSDKLVESGVMTLADAVGDRDYKYLSTHLIQELKSHNVIRIVISDSEYMKQVIYRQQMLQRHEFRGDDMMVQILKKMCNDHNYTKAAKTFLHFAIRSAQQLNETRMSFSYDDALTLDFSGIFTQGFLPTGMSEQHHELFRQNHDFWMQYQTEVTESEVIARLEKSIPYYLFR